jgi:hypothetical protein
MSSAIRFRTGHWAVSNMLFWRVVEMACEVGSERAVSPDQRRQLPALTSLPRNVASPLLDASEVFAHDASLDFWYDTLTELAQRIYERRIGPQDDQAWQAETIWAAWGLAHEIDTERRQRRLG